MDSFFALVALIIFFGILAYMKVPRLLTKSLDERGERIAHELEEARKLREEAEGLIADYRRKAAEAQNEASSIIGQAKAEAEAFASEQRRKMAEMVERRTASAEQKIAQAEASALKEVRNAASELAIAAAARLIAEGDGAEAAKLVDKSIEGIAKRLN